MVVACAGSGGKRPCCETGSVPQVLGLGQFSKRTSAPQDLRLPVGVLKTLKLKEPLDGMGVWWGGDPGSHCDTNK